MFLCLRLVQTGSERLRQISDLTFDDAMESQFVIYKEEDTYAAGQKMVQEYRGGTNLPSTHLGGGGVDERHNG